MGDNPEVEALEAKLHRLEEENKKLQEKASASSRNRGKAALSAILIVAGVILAPVATVGTWTLTMLVDTDRFVETFAPLSEDPAVQKFVADQAMAAIENAVDIDQMVSNVFTGIESLGLPPDAAQVLPLLEAPAADGIRSMLNNGVNDIVASDAFSDIWRATLQETHSTTVALIQGGEQAGLELTSDGAITLNLASLIAEVKDLLVEQGFGIAQQIPEIDKTITLFSSNSLLLIRVLYQTATAFGFWLPWITLGLLVLGVVLSKNKPRATMAAAISLTAVFFLLASGIGIGSHLFAFQLSPAIMSASAAYAIYGQLTMLMSSTLIALGVLSLIIAITAWTAGKSRGALALQTFTNNSFASVRAAAEKNGIHTGKFGQYVNRYHTVLTVATLAIGIIALFMTRPITLSAIVTTLIVVLLVLVVIELVRRPAPVAQTVTE